MVGFLLGCLIFGVIYLFCFCLLNAIFFMGGIDEIKQRGYTQGNPFSNKFKITQKNGYISIFVTVCSTALFIGILRSVYGDGNGNLIIAGIIAFRYSVIISAIIILIIQCFFVVEIIANNKIVFKQCATNAAILICIISSTLNILLNNYIDEIFGILMFGIIVYVIFMLWFVHRKISTFEFERLKRKQNKVNLYIDSAMKFGKVFVNDKNSTYRKYNKTIKNINKILTNKRLLQFFRVDFNEDRTVVSAMKLFACLGSNDVLKAYTKEAKQMSEETTIKPIKKAKRKQYKKDEAIKNINNYLYLLKRVVESNKKELANAEYYFRIKGPTIQNQLNAVLKKYQLDYNSVRIKFNRKRILLLFCLTLLIITNIVIKINQEVTIGKALVTVPMDYIEVTTSEVGKDNYYSYSTKNYIKKGKLYGALFNMDQSNYAFDKKSKWKHLKAISPITESAAVYGEHADRIIGIRNDGRIVVSNSVSAKLKTDLLYRYKKFKKLSYHKETNNYVAVAIDGQVVTLSK